VLLVARSEGPLEAARAECGERARAIAMDVTEPEAAARVADACAEAFGGVDVLVNNAGTTRARPMDELTEAEWQEQWELHVMAPMRLMRECAPRMERRGGGRIVNVCSSSGRRPSLTNVAYSVSKAAQLSLSRAWAEAWTRRGVLVNAVAPGPVDTGLWVDEGGLADQLAAARGVTREEAFATQEAKVPLGRFGTEDEVAAVIAMLCSTQASDVAGSVWPVDGGMVP
jgi:3-oxoacyl-[acyl-carrier protein] reductase